MMIRLIHGTAFIGSDHTGHLLEQAVHLGQDTTVVAQVVVVHRQGRHPVAHHDLFILDKHENLEGKVNRDVDVILQCKDQEYSS